jgi:hypothetical protein
MLLHADDASSAGGNDRPADHLDYTSKELLVAFQCCNGLAQHLPVDKDTCLLSCTHAGDDYGPAPDLDHANPELREALKHWLQYLQDDIGFRGWRLDFARG